MLSAHAVFTLRTCLCFVALALPAFDLDVRKIWKHGGVRAEPTAATPEKEAFEAAKDLGTLDAWKAFVANYPTGFHADLARAYIKKLDTQAASSTTTSSDQTEYPTPAASWGGIVRDGEGQQYKQIAVLPEGAPVALMGKAEGLDNGYPWYKIWFGPTMDTKGYMWGGILCSTGAERPDLYKTCSAVPVKATPAAPPPPAEIKHVPPPVKGCATGYAVVDGKCVLKRDASTYCGPGYHLQGSKCVSGYKPPPPQKQLPTWQQKAINKGCPKGMDWNAQEGCHEND